MVKRYFFPELKKAVRPFVVWLRHRGIHDSDIFLASYPKSGNTWIKFILAELLTSQNVGFDEVENIIPFIGNHMKATALLPENVRIIKTHEPYRPEYQRAIYIVRDGRDVAVSYYYHMLREGLFNNSFSSFLPFFLKGCVDGVGPWHLNVEQWLDASEHSEICIIKYEDCLRNPVAVIGKICKFVGLDLSRDILSSVVINNTISRIREKESHAKVALMKTSEQLRFARKGKAGDWVNVFSNDDLKMFYEYAIGTLRRLGYSK